MIDSITRITLNLQETNTMVSIRAKRGDTGRKLLIHLSDGSIPYHISDDCYATFTAKKPDGTKINNACTIENNVIEYEFTDQTCTAVGTMKAEIRLYGADDKMITSACFLVNVYDTVFRDGDEVYSEGEMNTLDDLILRANAFLNETGKLLRWQGNWDSETEYEANDLVLHEEVLYVAEEAIAAGTVPGSEGAAWVPIAGMGTGSSADLTGYATEQWVRDQDYLGSSALPTAVNDALTQAKKSGQFDGPPGEDGYTPQKGVDYFDGKDGKDGYTPVKGKDYFDGKPGRDGVDGNDYVLTDPDKAEIAEMAAELVDIPESGGFVVQDTEPEDTSVLWVDPTDNSEDGFQEAVNAALAQAKESGEFDGPPGQPGKDGKDGVVAVTGATVGQTVKISAVDENGVPTAWEPTDFPEGGGGSGDGSGWKKVVEYVWDGNKEYQPLSLDYATGEMTFDAVPPTNKAMWPALNFDGITKVTDLVSLYTKIPNEFMAAGPTSTMASGANGYTYGGKTTLAQGGANANVDVSAFHFEVSNTVPTFSGLNAKKVKIRIIAPGGNEWLSNSSFNFQVKLSNGTTCNSYSPSDGSRVILNLIEQTVSIDGDVYSSLFELTADRFQSRSNANQSVKYLYQRRITDRRIVPNGVTITEVSYPSGNGNYRPCNGTVVEVYVYED